MSFYQDHVLPHVIHTSMRQRNLAAYRERATSGAAGRVLEIGAGSGLNFPLYGSDVERVLALEPSWKLLAMARRAVGNTTRPVEFLDASAEAIPLPDRSVDTVVTTWMLCTIPDVARALAEMRRVLKPGGRLLFVEHGRWPDPGVRRWQDRLTPLWTRLGGGCHLNRGIADLIEKAGFRIEHLDTGYMRGPKPMTFMYEGRARS